jgi:hypothetical protein
MSDSFWTAISVPSLAVLLVIAVLLRKFEFRNDYDPNKEKQV